MVPFRRRTVGSLRSPPSELPVCLSSILLILPSDCCAAQSTRGRCLSTHCLSTCYWFALGRVLSNFVEWYFIVSFLETILRDETTDRRRVAE